MTFVSILFWLLFAFGSASIAKSKNRNTVLWAILGIVFGIFALIVVALMPTVPKKEE